MMKRPHVQFSCNHFCSGFNLYALHLLFASPNFAIFFTKSLATFGAEYEQDTSAFCLR